MKISLKNIITPSIPLAILAVISCIALWASSYIGMRYVVYPSQTNGIVEAMQSAFMPNTLPSNLISLIFTLINAFLLTHLNNRFTIIRTRTFLPIFIFLLLMSAWNETHLVNGSHLSLTLFILALFFFLNMFRNKNAVEQAFTGSLLIGTASVIINPLLLLIPICWIGFIFFQCFSIRTFLASIFGTLAPWILYLSGSYILHPNIELKQLLIENFSIQFEAPYLQLPSLIYSAALLLIMLISLIGTYSTSSSDAIQTRSKINFSLLILIATVLIGCFCKYQFTSTLPFIALVYSMLLSHSFTLKQNNFWGILFLIFYLLNIAFVISKYIPF